MRRIIVFVLAVCIASGAAAGNKDSQYVVGVGDVLQLNVWQVPSLDRQLTVRADGMIVLPMAGEIRASGNTLQQLEEQIARRLADFNRNVNQVALSVTEVKSRSIYVLGRVISPGKYAYSDAINLFDLIREAGGFAEDALRTRVKVVHRQGEVERVEYANVAAALDGGTIDALPMVRAGDTVIVSKRNGTLEAGADGIQIIGEVRSPAIYALEDVNDLVGVLLMAGGPSDQANLRKVRLVRADADGGGTVAREFNLESYLNRGVATQNPRCEPGDTIYVPKKRGNLARSLRVIPLVLGSIGTSLGIYYSVTR
jgi:protein involved in polysaccharide export with SLBB domain